MKNTRMLGTVITGLWIVFGCTTLEEKAIDGYIPEGTSSKGEANKETLYRSLKVFQGQGGIYGLQEMSTDALVGPTRGGDWDDNAVLRQLHSHTWGAEHTWIRDAYNGIMTGIYNCDLVLENPDQSSIHPEAKFFKAFFYYHMIDNWGLVPYREPDGDLSENPKVYTSSEATDIAIGLLEEVADGFPSKTQDDPSVLSKDAVYFLLAKFYLNKGVFKSEPRKTSYESSDFAPTDMNKVIEYAQKIIDGGSALNTDATHLAGYDETMYKGYAYWKNFDANNNTSSEVVFSIKNTRGSDVNGAMQYWWRMATHYNQYPINGWNGFAIPGEYYDRFDTDDTRKYYENPELLAEVGVGAGILKGQMRGRVKGDDTKTIIDLEDRNGNPLIFIKDLSLVITDKNAIETAGYRPVKYIPDVLDYVKPENDNILFRVSDAILMMVEAALRGGTGVDAQALLDQIRARAGVPSIPANLENVYAERGRELWLERWRRNDMIRFGKFLEAKELKPSVSAEKYLLYPVPVTALVNPNIKQNEGY